MTEERWNKLRDGFVAELNKPRTDGESSEDYYRRTHLWLDAVEMSIEVKELKGRLEAVESIMADPNAFYGQDVTDKVLGAVRGT